MAADSSPQVQVMRRSRVPRKRRGALQRASLVGENFFAGSRRDSTMSSTSAYSLRERESFSGISLRERESFS